MEKLTSWLILQTEVIKLYKKDLSIQKRWERGIKSEISFWKGWLHANKDNSGKINKEKLVDYLANLIGDKKEVKIANIGAGAASLIGRKYGDVNIEVIPSDILAEEYMEIRKELNISDLIPLEKQDMSNLSYDANTFDIVYCANAMDHCEDPFSAILEMIRVCKYGGWVYFRHGQRVGKKSRYGGLHQWNFQVVDGEVIIWNLENEIKLSDFPMEFKYSEQFFSKKSWKSDISVYGQKTITPLEKPYKTPTELIK